MDWLIIGGILLGFLVLLGSRNGNGGPGPGPGPGDGLSLVGEVTAVQSGNNITVSATVKNNTPVTPRRSHIEIAAGIAVVENNFVIATGDPTVHSVTLPLASFGITTPGTYQGIARVWEAQHPTGANIKLLGEKAFTVNRL